ncbi:MAG: starch-binding protein [Alistipes sp.]|nr:starch-binding protein [Alistipes sp.]
MKKLLYSILALAGVTFASCTQEHIDVQYIPENAVAPVLGAIEGCELQDGGADIVVEYTKADFGVATAQAHNLYVSKSEDMADMKKAKATFGDSTITMTQSDVNVVALDLAEAGTEVDLYFAIVANLNTDKGAAVAGTELQSNVVKATFKSYVADILPTEKFEKVWVIGDYCGWDHSKTQFLFDYNSTGTTFAGIVDFADAEGVSKAANGFKLTGVAGWDDTCNWGLEDNTTAEAEAASLQLITGGGSQDIKSYAKRFYGFEFDNTTLVLKKAWGADQIGIIGLNGDWDNDIVMEYNAKWTRFYADIEVPAATEMKFRADAAWDLNWGVDCAQGGDNIPVAAGNYRVYFNPMTGLIEFNAGKFGTTEDTTIGGGTTPEPEGPQTEPDRWGIVGTITEWGTQADLYMSEVADNLYVRMGVTVTDADQFKVRFNNGWDINYGAAGDVEPFAVTVGEELALVSGGKNLSAPAGTYDIYFNIEDYKMWVMPQGETPGGVEVKTLKIYGDVSATGWTACYAWIWDAAGANYTGGNWPGEALSMEGDYYVWNVPASLMGATVNVIFSNGEGDQTVDITGVVLSDDVVITLTDNEGGKWNATVNGEAPVEPEKPAVKEYGLVGSLTGWGGSPDIKFTDAGNGCYTLMGQPLTTEDAFKVRLYGVWDDTENYGLATAGTVNINEAITLITSGGSGDMKVAVSGTYDLYFYPAAFTLYVMTEGTAPEVTPAPEPTGDVWTIQGDVNNTQWGTGIATELVDGLYVAKNITFQDSYGEGANFKVLKNGTWMGSTAGGTHNVGDAIAVSDGGSNITMNVTLDTPYDIYIDGANNNVYVVEVGATPAI